MGVNGKKAFLVYLDWRRHLVRLEDDEKGRLLMAIFDYEETGAIPENLSPAAEMAFSFMQAELDRNRESYEARCRANRENGKKGGRPPKAEKE